MQTAVAEFIANVESVEKIDQGNSEESGKGQGKGGCGSSIGAGIITCLTPALALAVVRLARKKEEQE